MRAAGVGDFVELPRPFDLDRWVSDLFEIGQGRVDHAGTRMVEAAGALGERLDDFVPVRRLLGKEREDNELQIFRAELAARAEAVPAEIAVAQYPAQHTGEAVTSTVSADAIPWVQPESCEVPMHGALRRWLRI